MSVIYDDSTMNSPLNNSPFNQDHQYLNYATDFTTNHQINNFEKNLIFKYLINHSFNLIISNYQSKFVDLNINNLNQFILTLFKRLNLSLENFQKLIILMIRFFNNQKDGSLIISMKQVIIGLLVNLLGIGTPNWCIITGLSLEKLVLLSKHCDVEDMNIDDEELNGLNQQMKTLIYNKFDVIG